MLNRLIVVLIVPLASLSACHSPCSECTLSCSNGLATVCMVLDPPGCGEQSAQAFCSGGCDGPTCLGGVLDGGLTCAASEVMATSGGLARVSGSVAVSRFLENASELVIATSLAGACQGTADAGPVAASAPGSVILVRFPAGRAGTLTISDSSAEATLTSWSAGSVGAAGQTATAGSVTLNSVAPNGGLIGSYTLTFGSDVEVGSFAAPACDPCG